MNRVRGLRAAFSHDLLLPVPHSARVFLADGQRQGTQRVRHVVGVRASFGKCARIVNAAGQRRIHQYDHRDGVGGWKILWAGPRRSPDRGDDSGEER